MQLSGSGEGGDGILVNILEVLKVELQLSSHAHSSLLRMYN